MSRQNVSVIATLCASVLVIASARAQTTIPSAAVSVGALMIVPAPTDAAGTIRLVGKHSRQQLAVTAQLAPEQVRDVTRGVTYAAEPSNVVQVDAGGMVVPLADGAATVTAKAADGNKASVTFIVERFNETIPVNFVNEVIPVFTKAGCNGGGCHGKSGGQNGFRLSLLGFEPAEDYTHLVHEARARRLNVAAPARSLLLTKATNELPHGGGRRLDPASDDFKTVVRWIEQGMPYGKESDPKVARIDVFPKDRTLPMGGGQQLVVTAHYTDGSTRDVTRGAVYETNDKELGTIDATGWLGVSHKPGTVNVMVRYQGQVGVFQATLPLGAPVDKLPPAKNFVDELVFKKLKQVGMPPSEACDDATFIRRVTLDIAGRLPKPEEVTAFLADNSSSKREGLVDRLVDSGDYADYFANKWSALLRNKRETPASARGNYAFHGWIRDSLYRNKPFDQFVREIVAASGDSTTNPPVAWYRGAKTTQIQLEDTAQLFLGTRLQCAQCHHHPYEKWSQRDYYSMAAFFSTVQQVPAARPGEMIVFAKRGLATAVNKKDQKPVPPAALGAEPARLTPDQDPRQALADWMARPDNKFFAPSLVNRYWKHFFGRGLVDPEDDIRETNPATNPELLDALAKDFVASKFDLKHVVRTICKSSTYQLSSTPNRYNAADKQSFSRYYPRRLAAEVLLDAVNDVTKANQAFTNLPANTRAVQLPDNSFNAENYFLTVFGRPEGSSACECERSMDASLAQSLHLFNSGDVQTKLTADTGRAAALAAEKDSRPDEAKVRELYLWAFARQPDAEELKLADEYIAKPRKAADGKPLAAAAAKRQGYEDLVWALINTKEFLFNH
jgi:hypothetical protein